MLDGAEPVNAGIHGIAPWLKGPEGLQCPHDALVFGSNGLMTFTGTSALPGPWFQTQQKEQ